MCDKIGAEIPNWANPNHSSNNATKISALRNPAIHEGLFAEKALGFALTKKRVNQNLLLEMQSLTCRILAGIIGVPDKDYIGDSVEGNRSLSGLRLS
jgi:hypothetical protein